MSGVFISYRRSDSGPEARRLFERLTARFGADRVFIDAATLEPGQDFAVAIREKVAFCDALVAVIGPGWLDSRASDGRRRLDDPDDWVRLEIASALSQDVRVIPALVNDAPPPDGDRLPAPLAPLTTLQAIELRPGEFDVDVRRLERTLEPLVSGGNIVASWFALLTRRHRALDPLRLDQPETLWRAVGVLLLMMLVGEALRLPATARAGLPYWNVVYLGLDVVVNAIEWLAIAAALHLAMRAAGGRATLQKTIVLCCFMSAWLPLIALSQVPVWGLRFSITQQMGDIGWQLSTGVEHMTRFVDRLGAFGIARVLLSFALATTLWALLLSSLYAALRTLHGLGTVRALAAFTLGLLGALFFIAVFHAPLSGSLYAAFGVPGR
jgi:hypothetical protein